MERYRHAIIISKKGQIERIPYVCGMQKFYTQISPGNYRLIIDYKDADICMYCRHQLTCLTGTTPLTVPCHTLFEKEIRNKYHNFLKEPTIDNYPLPETVSELFCLIGIRNNWYAYIRKKANSLYRTFNIKKGVPNKFRRIEAPNILLKNVQRNILRRVLYKLPLGDHVGAYRKGLSCTKIAEHHTGRSVVIKLDIKDFFPSIKRYDVYKCLMHYGLSKEVSRCLSYFLTFKNHVPQGAPTSGTIANLVANWRFDSAIIEYLNKLDSKWRYDRYADDLIISHPEWQPKETITKIINDVEQILRRAGFKLNKRKIRVYGKNESQRVLGLVVNKKINLPRRVYMKVRAMIHNAAKNGVFEEARKQGIKAAKLYQRLCGWMAYLKHISPGRYEKLLSKWEVINGQINTLNNPDAL